MIGECQGSQGNNQRCDKESVMKRWCCEKMMYKEKQEVIRLEPEKMKEQTEGLGIVASVTVSGPRRLPGD